MLVRTELMEEGWLHVNDPWGRRWLLFPCSMVCVSQTDDLYQWLDSWSHGSKVGYKRGEENTRGRMRPSVTLCRDFTSAFAIQLPGWWILLEFPSTQRPRSDWRQWFFLAVLFCLCCTETFDFCVLICLSWLPHISRPCSETFFGTWCGAATEPYEATWPSFQTFWLITRTDFTKLDHCPFNLARVCLAAWLLLMLLLLQGGVWAGFYFLESLILFSTFVHCCSQTSQKCKNQVWSVWKKQKYLNSCFHAAQAGYK